MTAGPTTPFTWEIAEIFKVTGGQLHQIEAVLTQSPYGMGSGWSDFDDLDVGSASVLRLVRTCGATDKITTRAFATGVARGDSGLRQFGRPTTA